MDFYKHKKKIFPISKRKTMELLKLYEKERFLWDTTSKDYKHTQKRLEATERIAKTLNIKHFTSKHVELKYRSMRKNYCQELRKIAKSEAAGDDPVYRPSVHWFPWLEFVRPHLYRRPVTYPYETEPAVSPIAVEDEETNDVKLEYGDSFSYEEHEEPYAPPEKRLMSLSTVPKELLKDSSDSYMFQRLEDNPSQPLAIAHQNDVYFESADKCMTTLDSTQQPTKLSQPTKYDTQQQGVQPRSTSRNTSSATEPRVADCFDNFGNYVASMLKNMPFQRAMAIQPEIVKLLISGYTDISQSNQSDQN